MVACEPIYVIPENFPLIVVDANQCFVAELVDDADDQTDSISPPNSLDCLCGLLKNSPWIFLKVNHITATRVITLFHKLRGRLNLWLT